jgi:putative drug exporter of the RND superfamily
LEPVLSSIARFCVRRSRLVVFAIWIPLALLLAVISSAAGPAFETSMDLPSGEGREVNEILSKINTVQAGVSSQIVFRAQDSINDPAIKNDIVNVLEKVAALPNVDVASPYDFPNQMSRDGKIAYATVNVPRGDVSALKPVGDKIIALGTPIVSPALEVQYGGDLFAVFPIPESEALGLLAAIVILVLAFGSVLAMGLPIGVALLGLIVASSIVTLASRIVSMPDAATSMVAMIGIGVGIDYALFIVTRYREALHDGLSVEDAVAEAINTSGRAVLFAGFTVIIALLGLLSIGLSFVSGFAVAMAIGVAIMMIASVTLLPALLSMAGHRVDDTTRAAIVSLIAFVTSGFIAVFAHSLAILGAGIVIALALQGLRFFIPWLRKPLPHRAQNDHQTTVWWRWSRVVQRKPWTSLISASVFLGILAVPMFSLRLGFGDFGNASEDSTVRKAYDIIAEGFGPGFNGPLLVTVTGDTAADPEAVSQFVATLSKTEGVAFAGRMPLESNSVALLTVIPTTAPQDEATTDLVHRLRDDVIPSTNIDAKVGGWTAASIDFSDYLAGRLFFLIGIVLVLSFLLLMAVFRSILVPLKAVFMNLLSVGASYGIIVAVFQWGWASDLIGVGKPGPIEAWAPMFLFAIVFGLSMDYEVFLLSRMKEEFNRTGDNTSAVADGVAATARVITAAALIMVFVFAAFVLGDDRSLKLFGLGMAVAVFLDATIVRMLLVPATMELLGAKNWWIPTWLDRVLPRIDVEGTHHTPAPLAPEEKPEPISV